MYKAFFKTLFNKIYKNACMEIFNLKTTIFMNILLWSIKFDEKMKY